MLAFAARRNLPTKKFRLMSATDYTAHGFAVRINNASEPTSGWR